MFKMRGPPTIMPRDASLSDSCTSDRCCFWEYTDSWVYTEKTIFAFPFKLNWIWSWWWVSFRFFEPNGIPFGSENRKENCNYDHIPFNVKGNGNRVFSVWCQLYRKFHGICFIGCLLSMAQTTNSNFIVLIFLRLSNILEQY